MTPQYLRPPPTLVEIVHGLYIGDIHSARDEKLLKTHGITSVLSAVDGCKEDYPDIKCRNHELISVLDAPTNSMLPHLRTVFDFISTHLKSGSGVLVHCISGISRSSTAIISYLLLQHPDLDLDNALGILQEKYANAAPAEWFMRELRLLDKGVGLVYYTLKNNCYSGINPVILLRSNTIAPPNSTCGCDWARCRKCRADLLPACIAFDTTNDGNQLLLSTQTDASFMQRRRGGAGERLHCTKCTTKVGFVRDSVWMDGIGYGGGVDMPVYTVAISCIDWPFQIGIPNNESSPIKLK